LHIRGWLTIGAVLVAMAAGAIAGPAAASTTASAPARPAASGSGTASPGILGVIPVRGARPVARAATPHAQAACTEPNCPVTYDGGPVQHNPRVYVVFWGPAWKTNSTEEHAMSYLTALYKGLGQASDGWALTASQYFDNSGGHANFSNSVFAGAYVDTAKPQSSVTFNDLAAEATKAAAHFNIKDTTDAQIVVAAQSRTCFAAIPEVGGSVNFAGNCGSPQPTSSDTYCGYHSAAPVGSSYLTFTNLPFQLDAQMECGENFINAGSAGTDDGFSIVGGHEFAESATDPLGNAWIDPNDSSGGEVADKCIWGGIPFGTTDPANDVSLSTGSFAMQSLWSNVADGCVMSSGKLPLNVTPLGNQSSTTGKAVSLSVHAHTTPTSTLTFRATGLPGGLSIRLFSGVIQGTPNVTAGTFTTRVSVAYYDGAFGFTFTWRVSSPPGQIKGYASKCVDDLRGSSANGNTIDIFTCTGKTPQRITFTSNGELQVVGKCITATSVAYLQPCTGRTSQVWTRQGNGEYVLRASGKCLTEPSTRNSSRVTIAVCKNTANQHWSLP
jgi:Ricin-type beta-trefoil lectin domain/Putative Ig domain